MDSSFAHPVVLLPLGGVGPLAERFWIIDVDTGIGKSAGETMHKEAERGGVIQVHPGLMAKEFERSNVSIYIASLHLEFCKLILSPFMLGVVDERIVELPFEYLPGGHAVGHVRFRVGFGIVQPIVVPLHPAFDLGSFHEGEEQATSLKGVLCNFCAPVHENVPLELHQEVLSLSPVPFVTFRQYAFESDVLFFALIRSSGKVIEAVWTISITTRASWVSFSTLSCS
jgi:hypothetical protein